MSMFGVMLVVNNQREQQVLKIALEQNNIRVVNAQPSYASFLKVLQYLPDCIIIELPHNASQQLQFASMVRKHKTCKALHLIGYGDAISESEKKALQLKGIRSYYLRPLKFSLLIKEIEAIARQKNKALSTPSHEPEAGKDLSKIFDTETPAETKIDIMTKRVSSLLAFPFTVARVLQLSSLSATGAAELAKAIEADPVIATNILKVSNTVFFASLNRKISSIKDAIVRIGFNETKRIVMGMTVMKLFGTNDNNLGFNRLNFWYHSLACAVITERIARDSGAIPNEEAFLAGLLHDIGIIILDEFFPEVFAKALEKATEDGSLFIDSEVALFGVHHNDIVKHVFARWKMPDAITEAIVGQYDIAALKDRVDSPGKKMALCVALSDSLAKALHLGQECDQYVRHIENWVFQEVRLPTGFSPEFIDNIYHDLDIYRHFLGIETRWEERGGTPSDPAAPKRVCFSNLARDLFVPPVLYLRREGIEVEHVSYPVNVINAVFDMSLVWAAGDTAPEVIRSFTDIVKNIDSAASASSKVGFAPVVAVVPPDSPLPSNNDLKDVIFFSKNFDLRKLHIALLGPSNPGAARQAG